MENVTKEGKFIDRSKICPVLIRVFVGDDQHNPLNDYSRGSTPSHELQLYTWMDTSLKELMGLIRSMGNLGRMRGSSFEFTVVYADPRSPSFKMRDIGKTVVGELGADDSCTLASKKFQYGDFIDVAITARRRLMHRNNNNVNNRFFNRNNSIDRFGGRDGKDDFGRDRFKVNLGGFNPGRDERLGGFNPGREDRLGGFNPGREERFNNGRVVINERFGNVEDRGSGRIPGNDDGRVNRFTRDRPY